MNSRRFFLGRTIGVVVLLVLFGVAAYADWYTYDRSQIIERNASCAYPMRSPSGDMVCVQELVPPTFEERYITGSGPEPLPCDQSATTAPCALLGGVDAPIATAPYRVTLSGEFVCLPHVDTSGPQTDECTFGIHTRAGEYYALDLTLVSQMPPSLKAGDWVTASGMVTPIEYLSTDHWRQYPIEGIFSVTDSVQVEE